MKRIVYVIFVFISLLFFGACNSQGSKNKDNKKISIVTTTTMITDMMKIIGGDKVEVIGLMGPGVDPHLYKASEGDVSRLATADIIYFNGLHLEGKLEDVLEKIEHKGIPVVAVSEVISKERLIGSSEYTSNYDPHIWFNINLWQEAAGHAAKELAKEFPEHADEFMDNVKEYDQKLEKLKASIKSQIDQLPQKQRILVTAHDAFNYFGQQYGFEVVGLQGISTNSEAGVKDVQNLSDLIYKRKIKAIFIESSVSRRNIKALQEAVQAKGFDVEIGGELYSDALGSPGTEEGTYIGMYRHNVKTIVNALRLE